MPDKPRMKANKFTDFSYSRLWTYIKDPQEYFRKYVMGMWDPPSEPMMKGSIFSEAYANPAYDWKAALIAPYKFLKEAPKHVTFTSDVARAFEIALNHPDLIRLPAKQCEQTVKAQSPVCKLLMKNDGFDTKELVIENKFGQPWPRERAESEDQITFYAYVAYLTTGKIPIVRLQSVNAKTGEVKAYPVKKTKEQFEPLLEKIEFAYKGIINEKYEITV